MSSGRVKKYPGQSQVNLLFTVTLFGQKLRNNYVHSYKIIELFDKKGPIC